MRSILVVMLLSFLFFPRSDVNANSEQNGNYSTAYELIDAVNALRSANGLTPYSSNPILMNSAQNQATYMASIGTWTHSGPDGSRPYQRALAAGYLVAGDLSLGGFFSENVTFGIDKSAQDAVLEWQGDAPHLSTMLSLSLREIGAGVAIVGNTYYYVIDCGLSTGGTPVVYTPPVYLPTGTIIPNTPDINGLILHIVKKGDTIFGIAIAYGVPPDAIYALNNLTSTSTIYIGQKIYIRAGDTPSPTLPTSTITPLSTSTPWPTSTLTPTATITPSQPPIASAASSGSSGVVFLIIVGIAFGVAAILVGLGKK